MARPHPALLDLAAERPLPPVPEEQHGSLVTTAIEHRMAGQLWTRVLRGELVLGEGPSDLLAKMDLRSQLKARRLWRAADDVTGRLEALGAEALVAKGVVTEQRWYSRLGERPCNDLDLMLSPESVDRVDDIVAALQPTHPLRGSAGALMGSGVLQSIDLAVDGVEVDLHADLLKYEIPTRRRDVLWDTAVRLVGPGGEEVRALAPELALVHMLLHLNKDSFARLSAYSDIARLLARADLDWHAVDDFVRGEGLATAVYSTLHEVTSRLQLQGGYGSRRPRGPRAVAWQRLWPERQRLLGLEGLLRREHRNLFLPLLAQGRLGEASFWLARRRVLPPPDLLQLYYPGTTGPYPVRLALGRLQSRRRRQDWSSAHHSAAPATLPDPAGTRVAAPGYGVVVVHYRGREVVADLLHRVAPGTHVVVVDNSADACPVAEVARARPRTTYVASPGNVGFARAANLGAAHCDEPVIVFLNPDCDVSAAVLDELSRSVVGGDVAAAAPVLIDATGSPRQSGGWQPSLRRSFVHAFAGTALRRSGIFSRPRLGEVLEAEWLSGACLVVRADAFRKVGGFDETFFMYQEDMALGQRLRGAGFRLLLRADLTAAHAGGSSSEVDARWLWQQRGSALAAYLDREHSRPAALTMRIVLCLGFLARSLYYRRSGFRPRVAEMLTYARAVLLGQPAPPPPTS
jgi:N-acetylglucosaminyl-diphospho-decaprenol L-rhamnosyltransferase